MNCKCDGCKNRYVGCHGTCPDYKEFQKQNEKKKAQKEFEQLKERLGWR